MDSPLALNQELFAFEKQADEIVAELGVWRHPLRSILSSLFLMADASFSGGRFGRYSKPNIERGATILSRISHLIPFLSKSTPEIGADLDDALSVMSPDDYDELKSALLYGHFCDLMPLVRNGYLQAERIEGGFRLVHPDRTFAYDEKRDVIATELSLTTLEREAPFAVNALSHMVEDWPVIQGSDFIEVIRNAYDHYMQAINEDEYVNSEEYLSAFGFQRDDFVRVRAALMALASWCIGMAAAADAKSQNSDLDDPAKWRRECLEWAAPHLTQNFVSGTIQAIAKVGDDTLNSIMAYFCDDPLSGKIVSGDGFLAPLLKLGNSYLFSPRSPLIMTVERNLLYVANCQHRTRFDELISHNLEVSLLTTSQKILSALPGVSVKANVRWGGGEVDLLAFDSVSRTALQIQAKAAIPPQGGRMTRQVESNTLRAVQQLKKFEELREEEKLEILNRAFGVDVKDIRWASAVLSRSSFGTSKAWTAISHRAALNLFMLRKAVKILASESASDLTRVPEIAFRSFGEIIQTSCGNWEDGKFELFGTVIHFPNLSLDNQAMARVLRT